MTAPVFVDTNVFLYALDQADLKKHHAARSVAGRTVEEWPRENQLSGIAGILRQGYTEMAANPRRSAR